jgi:tetratricopeptide (TPR) repeat protein
MTALRKSSERNGLDLRGIARQKERLGYCHATNLLAGEQYSGRGTPVLAEREYREIIKREPDNPWGWLALGELLGESGRLDEAVKAFTHLCTLVPAHLPAYIALGEISSSLGNIRAAEGYFRQAESMRH